MEEICQKRTRKTRLVPRDCADFAVEKYSLQESIQPLPEHTVIGHSDDPKQSSIRTFNIEIEVEECNEEEMETIDNHLEEQSSSHETATEKNDMLSHCSLDEATIKERMEDLFKTTTSIADKLIEMEIKHSWGKILKTETPDRYETIMQDALQSWRSWYYQSKVREGIVSFKCYICKLAWWHLSPFREHIKIHDQLKVETEMSGHECHIVCYNTVSKREDIKIEGDCWKCLKSGEKHMIANRISEVHYRCEGCKTLFLTCFSLIEHEGICQKYHKIIFKDLVRHESDWKCEICDLHCLTKARYDAHLLGRHSVRSDVVIALNSMRKCAFCAGQYHIHNLHICPSKQFNFQCVYCYRKFQTTFSAKLHQDMVKQDFYCRICDKYLKRQCMEVEHMFTHTRNYILAFKCTLCKSFNAFPDEKSLLEHINKSKSHKSLIIPKKKNYEMVILPRSCMTGSNNHKRKSEEKIKKKKADETTNKRPKIDYLQLKKDLVTNVYQNKKKSKECSPEETYNLQSELIIKSEHIDEILDIDINKETDVENVKVKTEVPEELSNVFQPSKHLVLKKENIYASSAMFQESEDNIEGDTYEEMLSKVFQTSGNIPEGYNDELFDDDCYEDDIIILNTNFIQDKNLTDIETLNPMETQSPLKPNETITSSTLKPSEAITGSSLKTSETITSSSLKPSETIISSSLKPSQTITRSSLKPNETKPSLSNLKTNKTLTSSSKASSSKVNPNSTITSPSNLNYIETNTNSSNLKPIAIATRSLLKTNQTRKDDQSIETTIPTNMEPEETNLEPSFTGIKIKEEPDENTFEDMDETSLPTIIDIKTEPGILEDLLGSTEIEPIKTKKLNKVRTYGRIVKIKGDNSSETEGPRMEPEITVINGRLRKKYRCRRCEFVGVHREYREHLENICKKRDSKGITKETWPEFRCTKCDETFPRMRSYIKHLREHGIPFGQCPQCKIVFAERNKIVLHLNSHIKNFFVKIHLIKEKSCSEKLYQCKVCGKREIFVGFFKHWESHLELKTVKKDVEVNVETVNEKFVGNTALSQEYLQLLKDMLQLSPPEDDIRYCDLCNKSFARRNDCKRHIIEHLLVDAYANKPRFEGLKCQICAATHFKAERYRSHMRDHGFLPVYKCELCNKTFSDSSNFAKHKKVHNLRCLVCDICKKKFQSKAQLIKHIEKHSTTKPFECKECNRLFYSQSSFRKHRHNGRKASFLCVICRKRFACLKEKWQHSWEEHGERRVKADCPVCDKPFRKLQDVKTHLKTDHAYDLSVNFRLVLDNLRKQFKDKANRLGVDCDSEGASSSSSNFKFTIDKNNLIFEPF